MKLSHSSRVTALAVLTAALTLTTPALAAAPTSTVSVGGSTVAGSHPLTAASTGGVAWSTVGTDGRPFSFSCTSVSFTGTIASGIGRSSIGTIASSRWNTCAVPGGVFDVTPSGSWGLSRTGSAVRGVDRWVGQIDGFSVKWVLRSNPTLCTYTVKGSLAVAVDETTSPQRLIVDTKASSRQLLVTQVLGCFGKIRVGDAVNVNTTLNLTSPDGVIDVS